MAPLAGRLVSGLAPLVGHEAVRAALVSAVHRGSTPAALLLIGPAGVGKQRIGLWLGQLLLCEAPDPTGPCDACQPCRMSRRLEHPDIHWFFPLPRPKVSGGLDRLGDALEEARAAELATRREDPYYAAVPNEPVGIYLAHAQVIRRVASTRPAMAKRKIIIIGNAELLVPQEASPEAANALLKLLEEPPPDTTIICTSSDADALLPTVRSRLLPVRVPRLPGAVVRSFLVEMAGVAEDQADTITRLADGSIGRALAFLPVDGEAGPLEAARQRGRDVIDAAFAGGAERYGLALTQAPTGARGEFSTILEFVSVWLRDLGAIATGASEAVLNTDSMDWLLNRAKGITDGSQIVKSAGDVNEIISLAQFNINPQLALQELTARLARHLVPRAGTLARPTAYRQPVS